MLRHCSGMRITFVDFIDIDYVADTPEAVPIGGSQSALCYLARALAAEGHEVRMVTQTTRPGIYAGVTCLALDEGLEATLAGPAEQVVVGLNNADRAAVLRAAAPAGATLILWTGHDIDQPGVTSLADPAVRDQWDAFALVSVWQADRFLQEFGLPESRVGVMRNAVAPVFEQLHVNGKAWAEPVSLAYTSTPFRGLHVLLHAMPAIRAAEPSVRLKIYSSMSLYHSADDPFRTLYDWARREPGVHYSPAIPQAELPEALSDVAVLAYPNTFEETSCIAVMEAMAAGCRVVTARRGALPETTDGYARLIEPDSDQRMLSARFAAAVADELRQRRADPRAFAARMDEQVAHVNRTMTWASRAADWDRWLATL
jgi:glycosyltransferase involved in cell wall biosynthesis